MTAQMSWLDACLLLDGAGVPFRITHDAEAQFYIRDQLVTREEFFDRAAKVNEALRMLKDV